ncbi:isochorismatase family protein [Lentilactobacillus senioris]|uniref:isochorismatase family protein n=1 Tax=Lentilactobacillus senioris TaxID=931534 RepID=UPI002280918A|nr:isochorismatase family protein [Lentilactobacillus senioris]MCY9806207.1 isochorismatase family protein [Lentilactobacillus senioris]
MPLIKPNTMSNRDPKEDNLIDPANSVIAIIDYQPTQLLTQESANTAKIMRNVVDLVRLGKLYNVPIVPSVVNVTSGDNEPSFPALREEFGDMDVYDRMSINAWEDQNFYDAIHKTGRKKLIIAALWTEACLSFPTLDALKEGYEVYPVLDCVAGSSVDAHNAAVMRMRDSGAKMTSVPQLACEFQRNYDLNKATVPGYASILSDAGSFLKVR